MIDGVCKGSWWIGNNCKECRKCKETEAKYLRECLLRIAARCENWSPEDVRANVANALGVSVKSLEG